MCWFYDSHADLLSLDSNGFFLNSCISHKPTFSFLIPPKLWWSLDNRGCYWGTNNKSLVRATSYIITIFTFFLLKPGQQQGQKSSSTAQGNVSTWSWGPCSVSLSSLAFFRNYSQKPAITFKASQEWKLCKESFIWKTEVRSNQPSKDGGEWHSRRNLTDLATDHGAVTLSTWLNAKDRHGQARTGKDRHSSPPLEGKKGARGKKCLACVRAQLLRHLPAPCTIADISQALPR